MKNIYILLLLMLFSIGSMAKKNDQIDYLIIDSIIEAKVKEETVVLYQEMDLRIKSDIKNETKEYLQEIDQLKQKIEDYQINENYFSAALTG